MGYPHGVLQIFRLPLNSSYKQLESVTSPQSFLTFLLFSIDIDNNSLLLFIIIAEHSAPWLLINQLLIYIKKCNQRGIVKIKMAKFFIQNGIFFNFIIIDFDLVWVRSYLVCLVLQLPYMLMSFVFAIIQKQLVFSKLFLNLLHVEPINNLVYLYKI